MARWDRRACGYRPDLDRGTARPLPVGEDPQLPASGEEKPEH